MKVKKGKNFIFLTFLRTPDTTELNSINNLHDCIDVTSFIGPLLCVAHDHFVMKGLLSISKAAIKVACC